MPTPPSDRTLRDRPMSHVRPGVVFALGVAVALLGLGIIYLGVLNRAGVAPHLGGLPLTEFAAWTIGGLLFLIADLAWAVAIGIALARAS